MSSTLPAAPMGRKPAAVATAAVVTPAPDPARERARQALRLLARSPVNDRLAEVAAAAQHLWDLLDDVTRGGNLYGHAADLLVREGLLPADYDPRNTDDDPVVELLDDVNDAENDCQGFMWAIGVFVSAIESKVHRSPEECFVRKTPAATVRVGRRVPR